MVETVQFDVGGKLFKVSRDLIDQHPETMLAKLISETWEKDPDKQIFIDRDGNLFSHALNYLRYGSIELPSSIPRSMFDRELDYYGIGAPESTVSQLSLAELPQHFKKHYEFHKRRNELYLFALECYYRYSVGNPCFSIAPGHHLYKSCLSVNTEGLKVVNTFLEQYYGLKVKWDGGLSCKYIVSQKE